MVLRLKVFVINLKRSQARRERISAHLDRFGIPFEIFEATDGRELTDTDIEESCDVTQIEKFPGWLTKGTLGCALSKARLFAQCASDPEEKVLVIEDDCQLPENFAEVVAKVDEHLEMDELMLLYWLSPEVLRFEKEGCTEFLPGSQLAVWNASQRIHSGVCFALTGAVARKISVANTPVKVGSDAWGFFYESHCYSRIRCLVPTPIGLAEFPSDKGYGTSFLSEFKRGVELRIPVLRKLLGKRRSKLYGQRHRFIIE